MPKLKKVKVWLKKLYSKNAEISDEIGGSASDHQEYAFNLSSVYQWKTLFLGSGSDDDGLCQKRECQKICFGSTWGEKKVVGGKDVGNVRLSTKPSTSPTTPW